jgi:anti-sigma factor RsiW
VSENPTKAAIPSDLELMLYADGELEDERISAVEAFLARDPGAQRKLSSLGVVSGLVHERAVASASPADGIADALMAQIAAKAGTNGVVHAIATPLREVPAPIKLAPAAAVVPRAAKPANDNSRGIFALAAAAIAAAAALMIWGRAAEQHPDVASNLPTTQTEARPLVVVTPPAPAKIAEPAAEADGEHGVEVAAVDFGARMGSIFYVPTGSAASNATTTVVWLNDEAAGEP